MPTITTDIELAAATLRQGGLCAFPTETVYGLGAIAASDAAVDRIYALKGRPAGHPLIVHVAAIEQLGDWAQAVPELALQLAASFMPGPLTLILPRQTGQGAKAAAGLPTIALRMPGHPLARELLARTGQALAAPSANRFGRPSPTASAHVAAEFPAAELLILDADTLDYGIESTIVDLGDPASPKLVRKGAITATMLADACGVEFAEAPVTTAAPGTLASHYAPVQPLRLYAARDFARVVDANPLETVAALGFARPAGLPDERWQPLPAEPGRAARSLYAMIRRLEATTATLLAVETPPADEAWSAVADRLARAAAAR